MTGLLDFADRLENAADRIVEVAVHAWGEVVGGAMARYFDSRRDTGLLVDTLDVAEEGSAVAFRSRHYRDYLGYFSRGIPANVKSEARAIAADRIAALFGRGTGLQIGDAYASRLAARAARAKGRAEKKAAAKEAARAGATSRWRAKLGAARARAQEAAG